MFLRSKTTPTVYGCTVQKTGESSATKVATYGAVRPSEVLLLTEAEVTLKFRSSRQCLEADYITQSDEEPMRERRRISAAEKPSSPLEICESLPLLECWTRRETGDKDILTVLQSPLCPRRLTPARRSSDHEGLLRECGTVTLSAK